MDIRVVKNRISRGSKFWEKENKNKFDRFRRYLQIKHYAEDEQRLDQITVPYIHAIIRAKLPFLYYRNPEVLVSPRRKVSPNALQKTLENIDTVRSIMEYIPEEIGMEYEMKRAVEDRVAFGRGIVKIGFEYEVEGMDKKGIIQKTISKVKDFVSGKETPTQEEVKILVDRFYVKRVAYPKGHFIYDPESTNGLKDSRWCAEKIIEPLEDVKKNPKFKNTSKLKANATIDKELKFDDDNEDSGSDEDRLEYYLYWEKNRYGVVTKSAYVVPDQNIILEERGNPYDHKDFPYEELNGYSIPDYLFPIGDIEPMETQQKELDLMESIQTMHARSFVQKYVYVSGNLTEKQLSQLSDPYNTICEIKEDSGLRALENPAVNSTVPMTTDRVIGDMTKISGVSEYDTAVIPRTETTLGEAQMVQGGANNRKEDDKRQVEDFAKRVFKKLFETVQQYMTEDVCIQISGDGQLITDWQTKKPEEIQGEYDFAIQPNSAAPVNKQQLRQDNILLYNTFNKDMTIPVSGRNQLRKWVLESFDKKDAGLFETQIEQNAGIDGNQPTVDQNGQPIDAASIDSAPIPPKPTNRIAESLNYKDAPPDIKRQIEEAAGMTPSTFTEPVQVPDATNQPMQ